MARVQNNKQSYWDKINKNELNSIHACMTTLLVRSEMIILSRWLLFTASRFPHLIISPDLMTKQKGKRYQRIGATESFEHENTRSDFNY